MKLVLTLLFFFVGGTALNALPIGAPFCTIGRPAVGAPHLDASAIETGAISKGNFSLHIDGVAINASSTTPFRFTTNANHTILVKGFNNEEFKGALLVLSVNGTNLTTANLIPESPYQVGSGCSSDVSTWAGITHSSSALKKTVSAVLRSDNLVSANIKLDVNIVVVNDAIKSNYYYTQYTLESFNDAPVAPTVVAPAVAPAAPALRPAAPVVAPAAPALRPTAPVVVVAPAAPVVAPAAPVADPTNATVPKAPASPVAPIAPKTPTKTPTKAPTSPKRCGLLKLSIFCPVSQCGLLGKWLGLCNND